MSDPTLAEFLAARLGEDEAEARNWPDEMDVRWYKVPTYTPARVLREIEAGRKILELHLPDEYGCQRCEESGYPCSTLRALVAVYSDHPDYREDWRP